MSSDVTIESAAISDRGLSDKRPQNEDSFLEIAASGIFAVADGVGGAQAGEVASQMAVEILGEAFANRSAGSDPELVMRGALEQANAAIYQMSNDVEKLSRMATTVVGLHIEHSVATIGHVGDSRLYRLDQKGSLHRETEDHSMVAEEVRAGRMTEEQAENHPSKNIISRALGAEAFVEIDLQTRLVEPGSTFLICSDGVTRHIGDLEIADLLSNVGPVAAICNRIKEICYERGAEDNLTAVVVRLTAETQQSTMKNTDDNATNLLAIPDLEETTVTTSRAVAGDDDLLGLGIPERPAASSHEERPAGEIEDEQNVSGLEHVTASAEPIAGGGAPESLAENLPTGESSLRQDDSALRSFSNFDVNEPASGSSGNTWLTVGALILGVLLGLAAYHFFLKPMDSPPPAVPAEMRLANAPLSAFEDLRREVDKDPSAFLSKNPQPQDAEDHYLIGRAHLLLGDFPKARTALVEARKMLPGKDPANAKVLATDIAILTAVTNDTTTQANLSSELNTARQPSNNNVNANR